MYKKIVLASTLGTLTATQVGCGATQHRNHQLSSAPEKISTQDQALLGKRRSAFETKEQNRIEAFRQAQSEFERSGIQDTTDLDMRLLVMGENHRQFEQRMTQASSPFPFGSSIRTASSLNKNGGTYLQQLDLVNDPLSKGKLLDMVYGSFTGIEHKNFSVHEIACSSPTINRTGGFKFYLIQPTDHERYAHVSSTCTSWFGNDRLIDELLDTTVAFRLDQDEQLIETRYKNHSGLIRDAVSYTQKFFGNPVNASVDLGVQLGKEAFSEGASAQYTSLSLARHNNMSSIDQALYAIGAQYAGQTPDEIHTVRLGNRVVMAVGKTPANARYLSQFAYFDNPEIVNPVEESQLPEGVVFFSSVYRGDAHNYIKQARQGAEWFGLGRKKSVSFRD